jgi:hypothetical protein
MIHALFVSRVYPLSNIVGRIRISMHAKSSLTIDMAIVGCNFPFLCLRLYLGRV